MRGIRSRIRPVLVLILCMAMLMNFGMVPAAFAEEEDDRVAAVNELLEGCMSLQKIQDARREFTVSAPYNADDPDNVAEHEEVQRAYAEFVEQEFAKRAEAQAAYDGLPDDLKPLVDQDLLAKLTDTLETTFATESYPLTPSTNEYNYQILNISNRFYLAYELSMHTSQDLDMPCTLILADVSGDATSITLNGEYSYGTNNYLLTYCCDEREPTVYGAHYKRVNLEDCEYYNSYQASKIRAILLGAYPFIPLEEMKEALIDAGVEHAAELDRADIVAAVQFAIWYFSNRMTNGELSGDTTYGYTANALSYSVGGGRPLITSYHDYRNELWYWWNANNFRDWAYDAEADARVTSLFNYLLGLPDVEASENQFVVSDIQIARKALTDEGSGTYSLDLNIFLNHGASDGDSVTMTVTTPSETKTINVTGQTQYETTIRARYGDTVEVFVNGTQHLEKGVYFYEPEGGYGASQSLVGIAEGETKVRAENSFEFKRDIEAGLRIYKTEEETGKPLEGIRFDIYNVSGTEIGDVPTEEEIELYAVTDLHAGTIVTDSTGYGAAILRWGTFLVIEEPNEKVKNPVAPFYITLPYEEQDVAELHLVNRKADEPGTVSVELEAAKAFGDWGKADSFRFELAAVTEDAPMPDETVAEATESDPTAVFPPITFAEPGVYEYTVTEINDGADGVSYDTAAHSVTVTVTEEKTIDLSDEHHYIESYSLEAEVLYDGGESLVITNTYEPTEAQIEVTKLLQGRDWSGGDRFTVTLKASSEDAPLPEETQLSLTKDAQTGSFGPITFEHAGTFEYTVTEIPGDEENMEYDSAEHTVTITVSKADDATNALSAEVLYEDADSVEIVNVVPPAPAQAQIEVTKLLEGREWSDGDSFTVTLEAVTEGAPMPEETQLSLTKDAQSGSFGPITFEETGTFEYTVKETPGDEENMEYDCAEHKVTVTVEKPEEKNELTAEVAYEDGDSVEIINTKEVPPAPAQAQIEVTKFLQGREWSDDDSFTVTLKASSEGAPMPEEKELVLTLAKQTGVFGPITFEETGTFEYTVTETPGTEENMQYDSADHKVTVTVEKSEEENELTAEIAYEDGDSVEIVNVYEETAPAQAQIEVTKLLEGREWSDDDSFTVTLKASSEDAPMPEKTELSLTKDAQTGAFGPITFEETGTFEYTVTETPGTEENMQYDSADHKVTVTVEKSEEENKLTAQVSYEDGDAVGIRNVWEEVPPAPAEAEIEVTKLLSGREWSDGDSFTVTLQAVTEGAPVPEKTELALTKDAQTGTFGPITFENTGKYEYVVKETSGTEENMEYDSAEHKVTVTVSKPEEENVLTAFVSYDDGSRVEIRNVFKEVPPAPTEVGIDVVKLLSGRYWSDADSFTVTLQAVTEDAPMPEKTELSLTKDAQTGTFGPITFEKAGTFEYAVTETPGTEENMTYDTAQHKATVTIEKSEDGKSLTASVAYEDGSAVKIRNDWEEPPETGDPLGLGIALTLLAASVLALTLLLAFRRRTQRR